MEPSTAKLMKNIRYVFGKLFRRRVSIRTRLTACFVAIVLSMIAADLVVVWQLRRMAAPAEHLSAADQTSLAIVRVHLDMGAFRDKATALATTHDTRQFATEAASLRQAFLEHVERAQQMLRKSPEIDPDARISGALETLRETLPSQLETAVALANAGDWTAVRFRLAHQVQALIDLSSSLVERVDEELLHERDIAIDRTEQARRQLVVVAPIAAILTLLAAIFLGWYATRKITTPLSELAAGAEALARGEFHHHVDDTGEDELAVLGKAFNYAARRLNELYEGLRRSEKELRDVINVVPANVWSTTPDGAVDFVNERWLEFTGLSPEDAMGWNWEGAIHPDDRSRHVGAWRAALKNNQAMESEVRVRRADGEYRWWFARNVPLRDEHGNIVKWYGSGVDIEDRKRAEALLAGEKRVLEIVAKGDSLPQILDRLCRLAEEHASGVLASILLLDGNRLRHGGAPNLPKAYTDAIDGAEIGPSAGSCGTAAYRGEQVIVEDIATDPLWADYRGLALPYSLRACWSTPVRSSQGKVIATFAMYYRQPRSPSRRDQEIIEQITHLAGIAIERNLTQEALRRSRAYLAEAHSLTHTGSWAFNASSKTAVYWSEENFRIWGFDPKQGPPDREMVLQRVHPEDRDWVREDGMNAAREGRDFEQQFRIVLPDGAVRHIHAIGHQLFSASGEHVEVVGTHIDVTERKRAEAERERLHHLEASLAHINRVSMLGELAASLAHEIKQPIAAAAINSKTGLRWLQRHPPQIEDAREAASRVVNDVNRASDIIDRLRSFYTKGGQERELLDVNEVVEEMVVLLRNEASRYSIPIRSDLAGNLAKVNADHVQLQQVLMNLMLNGIEAMKETGGELAIKSGRTDDSQLLISVSDTGVGLPSEKTDQLFSAFFTTKPHGTGMGLAITRSIIEAHGGRLWATGNTPRGACFHFTLPIDNPTLTNLTVETPEAAKNAV